MRPVVIDLDWLEEQIAKAELEYKASTKVWGRDRALIKEITFKRVLDSVSSIEEVIDHSFANGVFSKNNNTRVRNGVMVTDYPSIGEDLTKHKINYNV